LPIVTKVSGGPANAKRGQFASAPSMILVRRPRNSVSASHGQHASAKLPNSACRRRLQLRQQESATPVEREITDLDDRFRQLNQRQRDAVLEGALADDIQTRLQLRQSQAWAVRERAIADPGQRCLQLAQRKRRTARESVLADLGLRRR
jgi:porphobilinogen deaminase